MKKRLFPATMLATSDDFNAVPDRAEDALADFVRAIAASNPDVDRVLFGNAPPTVSPGGSPWTVTVPEQFFAAAGVPARLVGSDITVGAAGGDRDLALFFRLRRADLTESRQYLDTSGDRPVQGTRTFTIERDVIAELTVVDPYAGAEDDPELQTDDIGYVKLAVLTVGGSGTTLVVDHDPDESLWVFPAGATPSDHASSHLPGGGDAIDLATPVAPGLIAAADLATVRAAVTSVAVATSSPFLVRSTTGDNTAAPKSVELDLRLDAESLAAVAVDSVQRLGLAFPSGGLSGVSRRPARSDHLHALSDSPVQVAARILTISDVAQLGSLLAVVVPESFGLVSAVSIAWLAPTITSPYYPLVDAKWSGLLLNGQNLKVGAKYVLAGARDLRIRIGNHALCELTPEELALVTAVTGSVTWESAAGSAGLLPTTGKLLVTMIGVRTGLTVTA